MVYAEILLSSCFARSQGKGNGESVGNHNGQNTDKNLGKGNKPERTRRRRHSPRPPKNNKKA